jgi:hypothetical protein
MTSGADQHETLVSYNSEEPREELPPSTILVEVLEGLAASLLNFILCVAPIPQDGRGEVDTRSVVAFDQRAERLIVSVASLGHQLCVVKSHFHGCIRH